MRKEREREERKKVERNKRPRQNKQRQRRSMVVMEAGTLRFHDGLKGLPLLN